MGKVKFNSTLTTFSMIMLLLTSCTSIRLISDYDEITDKKVTELQENFAQYFVKLERTIGTKEAKYDNFIQFYDDAKVKLSSLKVRANAIDKNEIVINQLNILGNSISKLDSLHKIGFNKTSEIIPLRNAFDTEFTALIKFQMGLKRGKEK